MHLLETADKAMSDTAKPRHYWARSSCNELRGVCTPESPLQNVFKPHLRMWLFLMYCLSWRKIQRSTKQLYRLVR